MTVSLSDEERAILGYLVTHADGCGDRYQFDPEEIGNALSIDNVAMERAARRLASFGLVDIFEHRLPDAINGIETTVAYPIGISSIWLLEAGMMYSA